MNIKEKYWDLITSIFGEVRLPKERRKPIKCDYCNGTGHDGFDRMYPPNYYVCGVCNGEGTI